MTRLPTITLALRLGAALLVLAAGGCDHSSDPPPPTADVLTLVRSVTLAIAEPSDLCLDGDGIHAWTVSDQTGRVYRFRLADGVVTGTLAFVGSDLEGIWQDPLDGTLYVAEEGLRQVVHLDAEGSELGRVSVAGLGGDGNSGLEGLTFSPVTGRFHVVNEKGPALLLAVAANGTVLDSRTVTFVADLSGITWDATGSRLWVVSDESERVAAIDLAGAPLTEYSIPVDKAEGIAIDPVSGHIYVISDSESRLYEFRRGSDGMN